MFILFEIDLVAKIDSNKHAWERKTFYLLLVYFATAQTATKEL